MRDPFLLGVLILVVAATHCLAGPWIRAGLDTERPVWGLRDGLMVGIWPGAIGGGGTGGPRGLIRVGYPLGDPPQHHLVNFLAVEPDVGDGHWRGLSEIEPGADGQPGKPFTAEPPPETEAWEATRGPYPGFLDHPPGSPQVERLRVRLGIERFANGAHPYLILTLRTDRPDEVRVEAYHEPDGRAMTMCVITATMGNYTRLRRAYLAGGEVLNSVQLWPGFAGNGFAPFHIAPAERLAHWPDGSVIVPLDCDEDDPAANWPHDPGIWWRWPFRKLTQYWRRPPGEGADKAQFAANARATYYGSPGLTIPGGVAFENTELREPYRPGVAVVLGVTRRSPEEVLREG